MTFNLHSNHTTLAQDPQMLAHHAGLQAKPLAKTLIGAVLIGSNEGEQGLPLSFPDCEARQSEVASMVRGKASCQGGSRILPYRCGPFLSSATLNLSDFLYKVPT
jgi:hypothetical protein